MYDEQILEFDTPRQLWYIYEQLKRCPLDLMTEIEEAFYLTLHLSRLCTPFTGKQFLTEYYENRLLNTDEFEIILSKIDLML